MIAVVIVVGIAFWRVEPWSYIFEGVIGLLEWLVLGDMQRRTER